MHEIMELKQMKYIWKQPRSCMWPCTDLNKHYRDQKNKKIKLLYQLYDLLYMETDDYMYLQYAEIMQGIGMPDMQS